MEYDSFQGLEEAIDDGSVSFTMNVSSGKSGIEQGLFYSCLKYIPPRTVLKTFLMEACRMVGQF